MEILLVKFKKKLFWQYRINFREKIHVKMWYHFFLKSFFLLIDVFLGSLHFAFEDALGINLLFWWYLLSLLSLIYFNKLI